MLAEGIGGKHRLPVDAHNLPGCSARREKKETVKKTGFGLAPP
jgi:hypothetical protein